MKSVVVVIGAGQIGQAIARRVGVGKHVLLADMRTDNAKAAADVLGNAGYDTSVATVDVSSRAAVEQLVGAATDLGEVTGLIHAAGVSPSQASPATILKVDLYGTALVNVDEWYIWLQKGWATVFQSYGRMASASLYKRLRPLADGYPDPKTGENTAISAAAQLYFTQVFIERPEKQVAAGAVEARTGKASQ